MVKILFIDLGTPREEYNEPIGIELLASCLKNKSNDALLSFDLKWAKIDKDYYKELNKQYNVIGISVNLGTLRELNFIYTMLKKYKNKMIVLGGTVPTFAYKELLKKFPDVICVIGEGEFSFTEICRNFEKIHQNFSYLKKIPNLAFNLDGQMVETDRYVEDLNNSTHPLRAFIKKIKELGGIARVEASRGCPWSKCSFCCVNKKYNFSKWRPFPIEYVIKELIILSEYGILSPYFTDEDFFAGDYQRSLSLANQIIDLKNKELIHPNMNFFISARINDIIRKESALLLSTWKKAGLREIFIGLESGVKNQLERYQKAASPDRNAKAINILKNYGFQLDLGYIFFDPEMSYQDLIENINYMKSLNISSHDSRSIKQLRLQPYTDISNKYKDNFITGELDVDNLRFPVKYKEQRIADIIFNFEEWEKKTLPLTYKVQGRSRGEVPSEEYRLKLKKYLGKSREIDLCALEIIAISTNINNAKHKLEDLSEKKINILQKALQI